MRIIKQGASFGVAGLVQLAIDWLIFVGLTRLGVLTAAANLVGRVTGALIGFWLNGKWTFRKEDSAALGSRHFGRYSLWWLATAATSTATVALVAHMVSLQAAWAIKPFVDVFLAGCSFFVSKYWIYR